VFDRNAITIDRQPDDYLRQIGTLVFGITALFQLGRALGLKVGRGRIKEQEIHFQIQKGRYRPEDLFFQLLLPFEQIIHGPVEHLYIDFLQIRNMDIMLDPFGDGQFAGGRQTAIGYHRKDRFADRHLNFTLLEIFLQDFIQMQLLPKGGQKVDAAKTAARGEFDFWNPKIDGGFGGQRIFWWKKSWNTGHQSLELLNVQFFDAAKVVEDLGNSEALIRITLVMGQLDVSDLGAIFIFARDLSYIHAYNIGFLALTVKYLFT